MKNKPTKSLESKIETLLEISKANKDQKQRIVINADNAHLIIETSTIVRLESVGNYTAFYLSDGREITSSKTLKVYESQLPTTIFFRIFRSHIININFVASFTTSLKPTVIMNDGTELEISRDKKKDFIKLMDSI